MSNFTYGEWRLIFFAFVAIFCVVAGLSAGEAPAILLFLPVAGVILYMAYRKVKT